MGKTFMIALVTAVLVSVVLHFALIPYRTEGGLDKDPRYMESLEEQLREATDRSKVVLRRLDRMEKTVQGRSRRTESAPVETPAADRPATADGAAGPASQGLASQGLAPDGTPYISRAELEAIFEERAGAGLSVGEVAEFQGARSFADVAAEMGLSAGEEASLRIIIRESEEEFLKYLVGDRPMTEIAQELMAAKEDLDKQAALAQAAITNGLSNMGKILVHEKKRERRIRDLLGPERTTEFLGKPVTPILVETYGPIIEELFD